MTARPYRTDDELDRVLKRDLTVLSTLALVTWLTTDQLHLLCFPGYTLATVRTSLRYFEEAGWIRRARWRIKGCSGSQVWTITFKGRAMVERYLPIAASPAVLDLARPTTALEQEEYRVQLAIRTLVVRLILEARQTACLAHLAVALPDGPPAGFGSVQRGRAPDARLSISWHPPIQQPTDWVPWLHPINTAEHLIHYPIYVDRCSTVDHLIARSDVWQSPTQQICIPVLILQHEERYAQVQRALQAREQQRPVRMSTWRRLDAGISAETWLDAHGRGCTLQLLKEVK